MEAIKFKFYLNVRHLQLLLRLCVFPFGSHLRQAAFRMPSTNYAGWRHRSSFLSHRNRYSMTSTIIKNSLLRP